MRPDTTPEPTVPQPLRYHGPDRLRASRRLYRRLNALVSPVAFSATLEDPRTVDTALAVAPGQHVVTLASGGDIPLALLGRAPGRVTAVDLSAAQLHLTELKRTAAMQLPYPGFRDLLGLAPDPDAALAAYHEVRPALPVGTRVFWDRNARMITAGLVWQGAVPRLATAGAPLWRPLAWRSPDRSALLTRRHAAGERAELLPCPPEELYPALSAHAHRIQLVHTDLRHHLRDQPDAGVDRFALSNIADWVTRPGWHALLTEVARTAAPGARVLAGSRHRRLDVPADLADRFKPDDRLRRSLLVGDRVRYFRSLLVLVVRTPGDPR
ncbi:DUF3419 family protein [Streptacidiphilus jiangxiensis]|uniref:S-adenosylmethionine:diacylglycerol 3-amino-3-carboxypropyl transferase n=1 Tax=Streptacidiphilus jiangxiensis TaxID=235985 RepID=A0A1H7WI36_STRJI|nr:DUF3419 family protein [Streptacidiphilus jiangxiensis]SEM21151.1 Protein of unknown function [Streptacidiphilus jiangxiensis]